MGDHIVKYSQIFSEILFIPLEVDNSAITLVPPFSVFLFISPFESSLSATTENIVLLEKIKYNFGSDRSLITEQRFAMRS